MQILEYIILALTYTSLTISLFLQAICFSKKIENWETLAFTISLMLLVISISLSPLQPDQDTTALSTLLAMLLVASTTFLDTLSKQKHSIHNNYKKSMIVLACALGLSALFASQFGLLQLVQNLIVGFLGTSIVVSMLIVQKTESQKKYKHLERTNKSFAWIFIFVVPVYIVSHFILGESYNLFRFDFILYTIFLAMAIAKIYEDLQRLSLLKQNKKPGSQQFQNYGLTKREQEIAMLLYDGLTYQSIADKLFISLPTVKTHTSNIYKKCKIKNRNELTKMLIS